MNLSAATTATVRSLRRNPAELLPFYLLGAAIPAIVRSIVLLGLAIAYLHLEITGRLDPVRDELTDIDGAPPDPEAHPDAFAEWIAELVPIASGMVTPFVTGVIGVTFVVSVIAIFVLSAGVSAGQLTACHSRIRSERASSAGICGIRRFWGRFLGLYLIEGVLLMAISAPAVLLGGLAVITSDLVPILAALLFLFGGLVWLVGIVLIRAVFVFAPVAIVVDGVGMTESVRRSLEFIRARPADALGYYVIILGVLLGFGVSTALLAVAGVGTLSGLIAVLLLLPAMDLLKTALYGYHRNPLDPPGGPDATVRGQLSAGIRRGWRELVSFVVETPSLHLLAALVTAAGFLMGWAAGAPFEGVVETSITSRLADHVPPTAALEFFGNNWTVTIAMAFAGTAFAVPAAISLWVNGFVFGIVFRLEIEPVDLLLFVIPHGVFEIPALIIAGAMGLYLGSSVYRYSRGQSTTDSLADSLERAFWVIVGVGILLAFAGLIEGFISPYYSLVLR